MPVHVLARDIANLNLASPAGLHAKTHGTKIAEAADVYEMFVRPPDRQEHDVWHLEAFKNDRR